MRLRELDARWAARYEVSRKTGRYWYGGIILAVAQIGFFLAFDLIDGFGLVILMGSIAFMATATAQQYSAHRRHSS